MKESLASFRYALLVALPLAILSCGAAAPAAAATPSLAKQCAAQGNQLGATLALIQSAKTQAEVDIVVTILSRLAATQPELVDAAIKANEQGLSPAFVKKAFTEACNAGII